MQEELMNNYSFWKLINKHRIDIPIIQRDYAQGRETPLTTELRREFIQTIIATLLNSSKTLHLNFVYGKIHGTGNQQKLIQNKNAIETMLKAVGSYSRSLNLALNYTVNEDAPSDPQLHQTSFIPLDGQQRLTTLFLLHWYLLTRALNSTVDNTLQTLQNFSYHIRPSTKAFCKELVSNPIQIDDSTKLSGRITDSSWFFLYWLKDPTVRGMLTMLDEIHVQCKELSVEMIGSMWNKLSEDNCPISFELLDLDELELTDELYVKMNARGESLTPFENFKAWLMQYISEQKILIENRKWTEKIDTNWSDLFWDNKDEENMLIDEEYMRYFRNMMQIYYVLNNPLDDKSEDGRKARNIAINKIAPKGYAIVSHSQIKEWDVLSESNLNEIFAILDLIWSLKNSNSIAYNLVKPIFIAFITGDITFDNKVRFYGIACYLQKHGTSLNIDDFSTFDSVLKKLIDNQEIDDVSNLKTIWNGFRTNAVNFEPLYVNLATNKVDFPGFRAEQVREERIKAALFLKEDKEWRDLIHQAEKHPYFNGQIGFLLRLSRIDNYYDEHNGVDWTVDKDVEMKNEFKKFSRIAREDIFDEKGINTKDGNLVERALLTYGKPGDLLYSVKSSAKRMFPKDTDRDYSWHRYLRGYSAKEKPLMVWSILESLFLDLYAGRSLADILSQSTVTDWRKCFIKYPETISFCGTNKCLLDVWWDGRFLLTGRDRRTDYRELETFYFYKEHLEGKADQFRPFAETKYWVGSSKEGNPCAYLDSFLIADLCIQLEIYCRNHTTWSLELFAEKEDILKRQDFFLSKLRVKGLEFTAVPEEKRLCYTVAKNEDVQSKILDICFALSRDEPEDLCRA